jgi:hypothetical protein
MKSTVKKLVIGIAAIIPAVWAWHYIDTKDFRDESIPIEVTVGETFDMKFESGPPLAFYPCWLNVPDGIILLETRHKKGLYEHLKYDGAGNGTDIYRFKAIKEGRYKLIRGKCPSGMHTEGRDEEMIKKDSMVTAVYIIIATR